VTSTPAPAPAPASDEAPAVAGSQPFDAAAVAPLRPRRPDRRALVVQLVVLVGAGAFLLWVNRHQWFIADEWNSLVDRRLVGGDGHLGIWDAHNSHLAATVTVVYRALFSVFGARTYLPYLTVMILTQLALMHVMWRVLLRLGIASTLATIGSALVVLYGEGFEISTTAFGMQNAGALALGFAALLAMPEDRAIVRRDGLVLALLVLALGTSSGVTIPVVAAVGLVALVRRGWRPALLTVAVPALLFLLWYALHGEQATTAQGALGTGEAIRGMPTFVAHGLWWALQDLFDLGGGGPVVLLLAAVLVAVTLRWREAAWQVALCLALGAPLYLAVTTVGRGGFGLRVAGDSRYAFVVLAFVLPVLVLAVDRLARRVPAARVGLAVAAVLLGLLLVLQLVVLDRRATDMAAIEQESKHRILAAAEIVRTGVQTIGVPVPEYAPSLTPSKIAQLDRDGDLPGGVRISAADRLTTRLHLFVSTTAAPPADSDRVRGAELVDPSTVTPVEPAGCVRTQPFRRGSPLALRFPDRGSVRIDTPRNGEVLDLRFVEGDVRSRVRTAAYPGKAMLLADLDPEPTLLISAREGAVLRLCGGLA
jgi:hypothetical protein